MKVIFTKKYFSLIKISQNWEGFSDYKEEMEKERQDEVNRRKFEEEMSTSEDVYRPVNAAAELVISGWDLEDAVEEVFSPHEYNAGKIEDIFEQVQRTVNFWKLKARRKRGIPRKLKDPSEKEKPVEQSEFKRNTVFWGTPD